MRLATLQFSSGERRVVGVNPSSAHFTNVDLHWADSSLPRTMHELLKVDPELFHARKAYEKAVSNQVYMEGKLVTPLERSEKIICIGLNYKDHAKETNSPIPEEPVVFGKFGNTIIGPDEPIKLPRLSQKVDYEAELVVVIGKPGKHIPPNKAYEHVAGYMCGHDVSARDWQKGRPGGQWLMGKSPDGFAPIGPWFVSADEIENPHELAIRLRLNGQTMQEGNTSEMIFPIPELIAHLSKLMTLVPGDLIFTGTPAGVGTARTPQVFLKPGDVVEVEIERIGVLRNHVQAE